MDGSLRFEARGRRYVTEFLRAEVVPTRSTLAAIGILVSCTAMRLE